MLWTFKSVLPVPDMVKLMAIVHDPRQAVETAYMYCESQTCINKWFVSKN